MSDKKHFPEGPEGFREISDFIAQCLLTGNLSPAVLRLVMNIQGLSICADVQSLLQNRSGMFSSVVARRVQVNRSRTFEEMIEATNRTDMNKGSHRTIDRKVARGMPCGVGEEVEVYFFEPTRFEKSVIDAYESRGLVPVDPYSLAAVFESDCRFLERSLSSTLSTCSTYWEDSNMGLCRMSFCGRAGIDWIDLVEIQKMEWKYEYSFRGWWAGFSKGDVSREHVSEK